MTVAVGERGDVVVGTLTGAAATDASGKFSRESWTTSGACEHPEQGRRQQHGAEVLHVDRHFDLLATIFGFRSIRLASGNTG